MIVRSMALPFEKALSSIFVILVKEVNPFDFRWKTQSPFAIFDQPNPCALPMQADWKLIPAARQWYIPNLSLDSPWLMLNRLCREKYDPI